MGGKCANNTVDGERVGGRKEWCSVHQLQLGLPAGASRCLLTHPTPSLPVPAGPEEGGGEGVAQRACGGGRRRRVCAPWGCRDAGHLLLLALQ